MVSSSRGVGDRVSRRGIPPARRSRMSRDPQEPRGRRRRWSGHRRMRSQGSSDDVGWVDDEEDLGAFGGTRLRDEATGPRRSFAPRAGAARPRRPAKFRFKSAHDLRGDDCLAAEPPSRRSRVLQRESDEIFGRRDAGNLCLWLGDGLPRGGRRRLRRRFLRRPGPRRRQTPSLQSRLRRLVHGQSHLSSPEQPRRQGLEEGRRLRRPRRSRNMDHLAEAQARRDPPHRRPRPGHRPFQASSTQGPRGQEPRSSRQPLRRRRRCFRQRRRRPLGIAASHLRPLAPRCPGHPRRHPSRRRLGRRLCFVVLLPCFSPFHPRVSRRRRRRRRWPPRAVVVVVVVVTHPEGGRAFRRDLTRLKTED
mmetsp:Transcript_6001/g.15622  ORF Transcript_6001/g.15622 Transcript_6001/m.15622 type:complete len:362 (-) Transcript_6001:117-1202(-)